MAATEEYSAKDMHGNRVVNLGNAVNPQDAVANSQLTAAAAAAQAYTDAAVAGLTSGQVLKGKVRAAVTTNVSIAAPGATLDGVAANVNDVFLLTAQSTGAQGGPMVWNGAGVPMTRPANWDTTGEAIVGSYWLVTEGTSADRFALMTNDTFTLGVTTPTFILSPIVPANPQGYSAAIPATLAGGSAVLTHNLNTREFLPAVRRTLTPFDFVGVRVEATTLNTATVLPDQNLAASEFTLILKPIA